MSTIVFLFKNFTNCLQIVNYCMKLTQASTREITICILFFIHSFASIIYCLVKIYAVMIQFLLFFRAKVKNISFHKVIQRLPLNQYMTYIWNTFGLGFFFLQTQTHALVV